MEEAQDLANILKSGKMPAPARIIQEEVVGLVDNAGDRRSPLLRRDDNQVMQSHAGGA